MSDTALLVIGCAAALVLLWALFREVRATKRRRALRQADEFVTRRAHRRPSAVGEGAAIGGGATAMSLYDIYAVAEHHADLLGVLEDRFNRAIPADASPVFWLNYFAKLDAQGPAHTAGALKGLVGQLGEHGAVDYLNHLPALRQANVHAVLFEDRTHYGTDIHFVDAHGHEVDLPEFSVKSYGSMCSFLAEVHSDPQSHYLVNHEVYSDLVSSGKLSVLEHQGIQVYDGHWSHAADAAHAAEPAQALHDASDVSHHVPWVGLAVFGYRTVGNVRRLAQGKATLPETGVEVAGDAARVGVGTVAGVGGAKLGALVGTAIAPGLGTVIGGGIGAILGAIGGSSLIRWLKEVFKYGAIMDALRAIGTEARASLSAWSSNRKTFEDGIARQVFTVDQPRSELKSEEKLLARFAREGDVYASSGRFARPTPMGALVRRHAMILEAQVHRAQKAASKVPGRLAQLVTTVGDKVECGFLGEIVAANPDLCVCLAPSSSQHFQVYQSKIGSYPNHPFRFRDKQGDVLSSRDVLVTFCDDAYRRSDTRLRDRVHGGTWNRILLLVGAAVLGACLWQGGTFDASRRFDRQLARADELIADGDFDGARDLLRGAAETARTAERPDAASIVQGRLLSVSALSGDADAVAATADGLLDRVCADHDVFDALSTGRLPAAVSIGVTGPAERVLADGLAARFKAVQTERRSNLTSGLEPCRTAYAGSNFVEATACAKTLLAGFSTDCLVDRKEAEQLARRANCMSSVGTLEPLDAHACLMAVARDGDDSAVRSATTTVRRTVLLTGPAKARSELFGALVDSLSAQDRQQVVAGAVLASSIEPDDAVARQLERGAREVLRARARTALANASNLLAQAQQGLWARSASRVDDAMASAEQARNVLRASAGFDLTSTPEGARLDRRASDTIGGLSKRRLRVP